MNKKDTFRFTELWRDIAIVVLSILVAVVLEVSGALEQVLLATQETKFVGSFVAGFFSASMFTVAPATVAIAEIGRSNSLLETVIVGATGAMFGDLLIFRFFKDRLSHHLGAVISRFTAKKSEQKYWRHVIKIVAPILGGLCIALPLPDEAGLALMGISKIKTTRLMAISFFCNMIGVFLVISVARSI